MKLKLIKQVNQNDKSVKTQHTYSIRSQRLPWKSHRYPVLISVLTIVLLLSMVFTGCANTPAGAKDASTAAAATSGQPAASGSSSSVQADSTADAVAGQAFPLTIKDANGTEMTVASEPKRIVSLTLGSDEMLLGLVDKSRIMALTQYADDAGISNVSAEAAGVAKRAVMDKIEDVIALNPDLVILDTWADAKAVKQMRDAGITVYAFKTPSNIEQQKATILELAKVTGTDQKGQEIVTWMDNKLKVVEDKLSKLQSAQKLTVMDYGEMGSSGKGTNFDDIVTKAGLINVVSRAGMKDWPQVSKEKMIEFNPDIIILPSWYYDQKNSLQGMKDKLKGDKSLSSIKAISDNRLISVPNPHISAISQYVVLGVEDVAKAAYPELFK